MAGHLLAVYCISEDIYVLVSNLYEPYIYIYIFVGESYEHFIFYSISCSVVCFYQINYISSGVCI